VDLPWHHARSPNGHKSSATAGPIYTPCPVILDHAGKNFLRRQALMPVDCDGRAAEEVGLHIDSSQGESKKPGFYARLFLSPLNPGDR